MGEDPMEHECECGHSTAEAHHKAAYEALVIEYTDYRASCRIDLVALRDRAEWAEKVIRDALASTEIGNMMTPPWVLEVLMRKPKGTDPTS